VITAAFLIFTNMFFRTKLIELPLGANIGNLQQKGFLQDQDLLDAYILGIAAYDVNDLTLAPSGAPVVAALDGLALTVAAQDQSQPIQNYPLSDLRPANIDGQVRSFFPILVDWQQSSFVRIYDVTNINADESCVFTVVYCRKSEFKKFQDDFRFYVGAPK